MTTRHEKKYRISRQSVPALRADLAALLVPDSHNQRGAWGRGYAVRSLYLESWRLHFLREKFAGLDDRFKLRIRGYPPIDRGVPLIAEIKRRHGEVVIKERTSISSDELDLLLASRHVALLSQRADDSVLRRFVAAKASVGSVSPLLIEYRREAFQHPATHVYLRATIDQDFWAAPHSDMYASRRRGQPFGTAEAIVEIKTSGTPPDWLPLLARKHRLDPVASSKYAFACARTYARGL